MTLPYSRPVWVWPLLLALVIVGCGLRVAYLHQNYSHPDEAIASHVVSHLVATGGFDTNWTHAGWLGQYDFAVPSSPGRDRSQDPQYNFSSYYLTVALFADLREHVLTGSSTLDARATVAFCRTLSAVFGCLGLVLLLVILCGQSELLLTLSVLSWAAFNPLLIGDAHYARPETFLTLLALGLLAIAENRTLSLRARASLAGFLFGLAVACKISFGAWVWLPFVACYPQGTALRDTPYRRHLEAIGLVVAGGILGLVAGLPKIVTDFPGYWTGVSDLRFQYSHLMGPYSHYHGGHVYDYLWNYLSDTVSPWILGLFLVGFVHAVSNRAYRRILLCFLPVLVILGLSGFQQVFFERNFSHGLPFLLLGAGEGLCALAGIAPKLPILKAAGFAAALLLAVYPAAISIPLITKGFSGEAGASMRSVQEQSLASLHVPVVAVLSPPGPDPAYAIRGLWLRQGKPFAFLFWDINEEYTRLALARIAEVYSIDEERTFPGLFAASRSPSYLRTYLAPTYRLIYVRGPKGP